MIKTYPSKVSYLLLLFIALVLFTPIGLEVYSHGLSKHALITGSILLTFFAFILYIFFTVRYTINKHTLNVKCGFLINQNININAITSVKKTNSILSSPAASFDRILIRFEKYDEIILSPKDKKGFINALKSVNSKITSDIGKT